MTTRKLIAAFEQLPEPVTERAAVRVIARVMAPRLAIGLVVLLLWSWIRVSQFNLTSDALERVVELTGSAAIFLFAVWPLVRLQRIPDAEWDRIARQRHR